MTMVELVAKRVADARQHGCHYAEGTCPECTAIARAAIEAMRKPTEGMLDLCWGADVGGDGFLSPTAGLELWRAMIDAALKD